MHEVCEEDIAFLNLSLYLLPLFLIRDNLVQLTLQLTNGYLEQFVLFLCLNGLLVQELFLILESFRLVLPELDFLSQLQLLFL